MRPRTKRRLRRRGLVAIAIAVPVGAWALEWAARQAEARGGRADQLGRRLRHGGELFGRYGRGAPASRLRPPGARTTASDATPHAIPRSRRVRS